MLFNKTKSLMLLAGILVVIAMSIFFLYFLKPRQSQSNIFEKKEITDSVAPSVNPELADQYKKKVKEKVLSYESGATAREIRDYLVAIIVPSSEYKDIHLDLVILFDTLDLAERNNNGDEKIKLIAQLKDFRNKNSWLQ